MKSQQLILWGKKTDKTAGKTCQEIIEININEDSLNWHKVQRLEFRWEGQILGKIELTRMDYRSI